MKSLTSRIEDLEYTAATDDLVGDYLFITRDDGKTYTDRDGTYTRADLDQLRARGASIAIINIRRVPMTPMPEDVQLANMPDAKLILSLPDNGRG